MWKVFLKWRKVRDLYIPPRRDKVGRRFGFVKFKDVLDLRELEKKLEAVQVGEKRVHLNLARFERHDFNSKVKGTHRSNDSRKPGSIMR